MDLVPVFGLARLILLGLAGLWLGLLVFGFIFGRPTPDGRNKLPRSVRMASSVVLVVAAWVWWLAGTASTSLSQYGLFILLGMGCGFLGDLFLARLLPAPNRLAAGMISFGLGHGLYIAAFGSLGSVLGWRLAAMDLVVLAVYWLAALGLWWTWVRAPARSPALNYGTLGYGLLLATTAALAGALALRQPWLLIPALGGLLFMISDLILGNQVMRGTQWRYSGDVIWVSYSAAQLLIVYTSAVALGIAAA